MLEVSVDVGRLWQVDLRLQVLVAKLDSMLVLIDAEHLDLAESPTRACRLLLNLLFFLLGALGLIIILSGYRRELGLEL